MENLEQLETSSNNEFGKFKDAESLLKAYNNLQAEFTKKSQRLASMESEAEMQNQLNSRKEELSRQVDEFVAKFDSVKPFSSALKETLTTSDNVNLYEEAIKLISSNYKSAENYAEDDEFLNNYIYNNKNVREKIVKDYLSRVTQNSPIKVDSSTSSLSITPPKIPTTIEEAGKLAKSIIKNK